MTGGQIFNVIVEFFEEDEWDFQWMEGLPVLKMDFTGKNGKLKCYAQAREDQEQFVFYSVCPITVPENKRQLVAEFITRANYGMIIGNFEMDFNDGEVRYKTSIDVEGDTLRPQLIKQMVYANVIIMDRYLPGILGVSFGSSSALDEIEKIEGLDDEQDLDDDDMIDVLELDDDELAMYGIMPSANDDAGDDDDDDDDDDTFDDDEDDDEGDDDDDLPPSLSNGTGSPSI